MRIFLGRFVFYNRSVVRRFDDGGKVDAYLSMVMGKGIFCNVGDLTIGVQNYCFFVCIK